MGTVASAPLHIGHFGVSEEAASVLAVRARTGTEHYFWDLVRLVEFSALWVGSNPANLWHGRAWREMEQEGNCIVAPLNTLS